MNTEPWLSLAVRWTADSDSGAHAAIRHHSDPSLAQTQVSGSREMAIFYVDGKSIGNIVLEQGQLLTTGAPKAACSQDSSEAWSAGIRR